MHMHIEYGWNRIMREGGIKISMKKLITLSVIFIILREKNPHFPIKLRAGTYLNDRAFTIW
jgi:hypothetical protein